MGLGDVAQGESTEERGRALERGAPAFQIARLEFVGGESEPTFGGGVKGQAGVFGADEVADLVLEFSEAALGELAIGGLERPSKLLAATFDQGIVKARCFVRLVTWQEQAVEVRDSLDLLQARCLVGHRSGFRLVRSHARAYRVTSRFLCGLLLVGKRLSIK